MDTNYYRKETKNEMFVYVRVCVSVGAVNEVWNFIFLVPPTQLYIFAFIISTLLNIRTAYETCGKNNAPQQTWLPLEVTFLSVL